MATKTDLMIGDVFDRIMEILPGPLKSNTKAKFALVTTDKGNMLNPDSLTVSSNEDRDRWISFRFIYAVTGEVYVKQSMGSIDGGSIESEHMYRLDPNDIDSSVDGFIKTVFIPKVSAVFKEAELSYPLDMKKALNEVYLSFIKYLQEFTDGMDVVVNKEWINSKSSFVIESVDIHDRDKGKDRTLVVTIASLGNTVFVKFDTESIYVRDFNETSMYSLEALVRDVINNNFSEGLRNMDRED